MKTRAFVLPLMASAGAVILTFLQCSAAQAYGVTVNSKGLPTVDFNDGDIGRTLDPSKFIVDGKELHRAVFTVSNFIQEDADNGGSVTLNVRVKNKDRSTNVTNAVLSSLRVRFLNNVTGAKVTNDDGEVVFKKANVYNSKVVCVSAQNCGRTTQAGLLGGAEDSFNLIISGDFQNGATFKQVRTRSNYVQDGHYLSDDVAGVPEPITILGSGAALAFGALMKKRQSGTEKSGTEAS